MRHILAATDLSSGADRGIGRALLLARETGARVTVLHVVDVALPQDAIDERCDETEKRLRAQLASLPGGPDVSADIAAVPGEGMLEVLRQAERRGADLIVVGAHHAGVPLDLFRGTSGGRLVRGGIPVLLAREHPTAPYRSAVAAVEPSGASETALAFALEWLHDAQVHVVHAYEIPFAGLRSGAAPAAEAQRTHQEALDAIIDRVVTPLRASLGQRNVTLSHRVRRGEVIQALRREVKRQEAQLLVVGTHARRGLAHAVLGSVAEDLLRQPPCDLLVVRGPH